MKKSHAAAGAILLCFCCLMSPGKVEASNSKMQYAYNYDAWGDERESPNPYTADRVLFGNDLGIGQFKSPEGLFVQGDYIYIVDSGNNRIVQCDANLNLTRIIDGFMLEGEISQLSNPSDVFVTAYGDIYIADTNNRRIVHLDNDLNVVKIITKPMDALMDADSEFLPMKLVVDNADRIYLLAKNVNKGVMEFDIKGSFTGYVGANKVDYSIADMIWKTLSTRAQREQMLLFVPTEYSNIALDHKGFLYTTCSTVSESDLMNVFEEESNSFLSLIFNSGESSNVEPIRRLNSMGEDILLRNGWLPPIGDWYWTSTGDVAGPSKFVDIVSIKNDTYFGLDRTRGRIFAYDFQGNLLFAFGGIGNKAGYFQYPTAIEYINGSILVLDGRSGGVTIFNPTEYGKLIHEALSEYIIGEYDQSAEKWEQVLKYNANYDLAYIGIGRSLLRQDQYEEAMGYFELKYDHENYSKAFKEYRKQAIEKNIAFIISGVIALIILWTVFKQIRRLWFIRKSEGGTS